MCGFPQTARHGHMPTRKIMKYVPIFGSSYEDDIGFLAVGRHQPNYPLHYTLVLCLKPFLYLFFKYDATERVVLAVMDDFGDLVKV